MPVSDSNSTMPAQESGKKKRLEKVQYALVLLLLSLIPIQALTSIRMKSATFEEGVHLAAGVVYLEKGDYSKIPGYPPLGRMWLALPAWLSGSSLPEKVAPPEEMYPFGYGARFLYESNDADTVLFKGRAMVAILAVILGGYIFGLAKDIFGWKAALPSLLLYSFSPNILAHARLATLDLTLTTFFFIAFFHYRQALLKGGKGDALFAGIAAFLTVNTKFTGWMLFGVFGFLSLFFYVINHKRPEHKATIRRSWAIFGFVFGFTVLALHLQYGDRGAFTSIGKYYNNLPRNRKNAVETVIPETMALNPLLSKIPLLLPAEYARGFDLAIYNDLSIRHPNWYLGKRYSYGEHWWHYYLTAMALKMPVASLVILLMSCVAGIAAAVRFSEERENLLFLLIPVVVILFFFSIICHSQLGLRLVLPMFPFCFVAAGYAVLALLRIKIAGTCALMVLIGWYLISSVRIHPHYLSYFNEIAGGPTRGIKYFADSNLDWGQDIKGLKYYMNEKGIAEINLFYYGPNGNLETDYYGIQTASRNNRLDAPWAISATWLYYTQDSFFQLKVPFPVNMREPEPDDRIGYSINIYRVDKR